MKVSLFKKNGSRETLISMEMDQIVTMIGNGQWIGDVHHLRELYLIMSPRRTDDGRMIHNMDYRCPLPMIGFAAQLKKRNGKNRLTAYNGLVVLEANNLANSDEAIILRNRCSRLPQVMLAFLGASGRSVKIVCRGELFPDQQVDGQSLPQQEKDIEAFHNQLYRTARTALSAQLDVTFDRLPQPLDRVIYMSADPDLVYKPQATPFYVDLRPEVTASVSEWEASHNATTRNWQLGQYLLPGRSQNRTYRLNYQFVVSRVLGQYFDLPDEDRADELLMQVAARCLEEQIPQAIAERMTMMHPLLNQDKLLVKKTFDSVYTVEQLRRYQEKNRFRPLKSIPEEAQLMMKTEMFLNTNYDMRKNVMTGVAQYREKAADSDEFFDLDEEARNEMTMRAKELGLKSWDRDIARFIESPRIEKFDPLNTWLDRLPRWDGQDRIAELAKRVPTSQPHWADYLRIWLLGMVAHWRGLSSLSGNALVPLLIGRQGCGKSSFCRILLPPELRDYYNDRISFKNETDLNLGLTSFALINIDEFDKTTQRQQVLLKYLLSTADVKFRPPYGKAIRQYRRYASFIATTNQPKPLTDPTGSRRFVCVEVEGLIDFADNIDHRQLYAQLLQMVGEGECYWLNDEETARLIVENEPYQRIDSLAELIKDTFRVPQPGEQGRWLTPTEVLLILQKRFKSAILGAATPKKIGNILCSPLFGLEPEHKMKGNSYLLIEK